MQDKSLIDEGISKAVAIFRGSPDLQDEGAYRALTAMGVERQLAARLVEFTPIAYCRVILAHSGAWFSQTFQRAPLRELIQERPFSTEPVWNAALEFARAEVKRGVPAKDLLLVAARSAEFDAANQLLKNGSKLGDLTFTSPILVWPESGPHAS